MSSFTLTNTGNNIGTLSGSTGAITLTDAAANGLTLGTTGAKGSGVSTSGVVQITNTGAITLANSVSSQAIGDAIVLSSGATTGTAFTVDAGATLSASNGRFLVFTDTVGDVNNAGGLSANPFYGLSFAQFSANSTNATSFDKAHTGSRFVYAQSETLTVTPTGATRPPSHMTP